MSIIKTKTFLYLSLSFFTEFTLCSDNRLQKNKNYYLSVRDCCLPVNAPTFFGSMAKALS